MTRLPIKLTRCAFALIAVFAADLVAVPLSAQTVSPSASQSIVLDLPEGDRPVVVRTSFHLLDINQIDDAGETFAFSGILTLKWRDSRQSFDTQTEGVPKKYSHGNYQFNELSPAWYPQVMLANAVGGVDSQGVLLTIEPDGTSTLVQPITAIAKDKYNLRRYPFDHQQLDLRFEVMGFSSDEVQLVSDANDAVSVNTDRVRIPGWGLGEIIGTTGTNPAPYAGAIGNSSLFAVSVQVQRRPFFVLRLVVFPLVLIVILSWSVFWMERSSLGDRMSVSFVGILTAVAYQLLVTDHMPQIAYFTLIHAFLNFSFFIMCLTVIVNLIGGVCDKRGHDVHGDLIDRRCRWLFPVGYVALLGVATLTAFTVF